MELGLEDNISIEVTKSGEEKDLRQEKTGHSDEMIGPNKENSGLNDEMIGLNKENSGLNDEMIGLNKENSELNSEKIGVENQDDIIEQLKNIAEPARNKARLNYDEMEAIILRLCKVQYLTLQELAEIVNRDGGSLRKRYITPLLQEDKLELLFPETPRHKKQAYLTKFKQ